MVKTQEEKEPVSLFNRIFQAIKKSFRERKLRKNPIYLSEPKASSFNITTSKSGDYSLLEKRLEQDSLIALIFGKRGSGKSALGFRILENIHGKTKRKCFVLGINKSLMPCWISELPTLEDAPNGSIILVDESALAFNSRESMNLKNRELSKLLAIARHKNLSLLFITQNTGLIDRNILKLVDTLFVKEGSLLQLEMERAEIRKFYEKAKEAFTNLSGQKQKYAYVLDADFEGTIEHTLPSFWSDDLSKNQQFQQDLR